MPLNAAWNAASVGTFSIAALKLASLEGHKDDVQHLLEMRGVWTTHADEHTGCTCSRAAMLVQTAARLLDTPRALWSVPTCQKAVWRALRSPRQALPAICGQSTAWCCPPRCPCTARMRADSTVHPLRHGTCATARCRCPGARIAEWSLRGGAASPRPRGRSQSLRDRVRSRTRALPPPPSPPPQTTLQCRCPHCHLP